MCFGAKTKNCVVFFRRGTPAYKVDYFCFVCASSGVSCVDLFIVGREDGFWCFGAA